MCQGYAWEDFHTIYSFQVLHCLANKYTYIKRKIKKNKKKKGLNQSLRPELGSWKENSDSFHG